VITKPIRVLLFSNGTVRAGIEEHMLQLLNGFDRRWITPFFACTPQLAELVKSDVRPDVGVFSMSIDRITDSAGMAKLARVLRQHRIQVLHSHVFRASLFASPIGRLCGVPVVLETSHGREVWRKGWIKSRFFIDRFAARFVDYVISVSGATARYLVEQKGLSANKIVVIRGAANLKPFDPSRPAPHGLKRSLGFSENDPVLLVLARLEPQKGHLFLLEAMPLILQRHPDARLVCVGDGALRPELEGFVAAHGLAGNVRFVGRQTDIGKWLALADMTVLPSLWEGLPLAVIESLAAGKPVVATAVDGTPDVVVDGKTGFTVPARDPVRLAEAVNRTLSDPIRAREMAQAGREWVLREFDVQKMVQSTQQLYLRALEEKLSASAQRAKRPAESATVAVESQDLLPEETGVSALSGEGHGGGA
jgi:glycosyltransferase involved in cell wall biosynthesis